MTGNVCLFTVVFYYKQIN